MTENGDITIEKNSKGTSFLKTSDDVFEEILDGYHSDFELVGSANIVDKLRWEVLNEQIVKRVSDGTFWRIRWNSGATEYQDYVEPEYYACKVVPVEVVTIEYKVTHE